MTVKNAVSLAEDALTRGVAELIDPDGNFRKKLEAKVSGTYDKDIVIKFGVDPTKPDLHLGHACVLRALRRFQDMGCKIIFLIGDFTARIGDPTGKSKVRPEIEIKEIAANLKTYLDQVGKILLTDEKHFSWIGNSDWFYTVSDIQPTGKEVKITFPGKGEITVPGSSFLAKAAVFENTRMQKTVLKREVTHDITLNNFMTVLRHITHSRIISRDMFQDRLKKNEELYLHELMYPVLQGLDSHVLAKVYGSCDMEIGGSDQTFNMIVGRDVMKTSNQEPQAVLAMRILVGTDGKQKMSKSMDNYIAVTDTPRDMFGKIMSLPDYVIPEYFELTTYTPQSEIAEITKELKKKSVNPKNFKVRLAKEIIAIYYGEEAASKASEEFDQTFSKGKIPDDAPKLSARADEALSDLLVKNKIIESKSEFRRLITAGAISVIGGENISDPNYKIPSDIDLRIGKHRFAKIRIS